MHAESTALHPTAVKVLAAVAATEAHALNYPFEIALAAGVSESTARRWLRRMQDQRLVDLDSDQGSGPGKKDWIWDDPNTYWTLTHHGEQVLETKENPDASQ